MRDPARIKNILDKIEKAWSIYPDMRFFQFMSYLLNYDTDLATKDLDFYLFFLEEDALEKIIDNFIEHHEKE